jgi:hypothetical protein
MKMCVQQAVPVNAGRIVLHGEEITERATEVVYTAHAPLPDDLRDAFVLSLRIPEDTAGDTLYFPTVQTCEDGEHPWIEIPADGPGVTAVTVASDQLEATTMVIVSDLDIIVKSSRNELFVFARTHHDLPREIQIRGRLGGEDFDVTHEIVRDQGLAAQLVPRLWAGAFVYPHRPDDQLRDVLDRFRPELRP